MDLIGKAARVTGTGRRAESRQEVPFTRELLDPVVLGVCDVDETILNERLALVEKLGGKITRDDKLPGKPVVRVDLRRTDVSGADLRALAPLQHLRHLDLSHTAASGSDALAMATELSGRLAHVHLAYGTGAPSGPFPDEHLVPGRGGQTCAELLGLL